MSLKYQHERLREIRESLGMNQSKFSSSLGIDQAYLSQLENGKVGIGNKFMLTLMDKHNISSDWILSGEGSMFKQDNTRIVAKALIDIEEIIKNLKNQGITINVP
jgi:transcriptional regulator with XRE-family HTH domain